MLSRGAAPLHLLEVFPVFLFFSIFAVVVGLRAFGAADSLSPQSFS